MAHFVLLHSRALGPASFAPLRSVLEARGHRASVPVVDPSAAWHELPDRLVDTIEPARASVVVAHSGAGLLAPAVARAVHARSIIFLDAQLPPPHGSVPPAEPNFITFLSSIVGADGVLPAWADWWGSDVFGTVLPDPALRTMVRDDIPRLSLSWFNDNVEVPEGWRDIECSYVRLSRAYESEASDAAALGMPVTRLDGTHLEHVNQPAQVADAILST